MDSSIRENFQRELEGFDAALIPIGIATQVSMSKSPKPIGKKPRQSEGARIRRALGALARLLGRQAASGEVRRPSSNGANQENSDEE